MANNTNQVVLLKQMIERAEILRDKGTNRKQFFRGQVDMTDEEAFAIVVRGGAEAGKAIASLFSDFGGSAEGNVKKKTPKV